MQIIRANIFSQFPELVFGLSTKFGLHRKSPYYFNMSTSVGDDEKLVLKNREYFALTLGLSYNQICWQAQTHSDIINIPSNTGKAGEGDAFITNKPGFVLAVSTADCTTIYLYEKAKKIIAVIHSGWMGTEKRIVEKTIQKMIAEFSAVPDNMYAYIGPTISARNYEVGLEFSSKFDKKYLTLIKNKFRLNLKLANFDMLKNSGIPEEQIEISDLCSFREKDLLHSYRRDGKISGRAWGVICLKSD